LCPVEGDGASERARQRHAVRPTLDHQAIVGAECEQVVASHRESRTKRGATRLGSFKGDGYALDDALRFDGAGGGVQKLHQPSVAYVDNIFARLFQLEVGLGERINISAMKELDLTGPY